VASVGHDKKWQRRMEKAAQKAESIGSMDLATAIRHDYAAYDNPIDICMFVLSTSINRFEDTVRETDGKCSFEDVIEIVADYNGMNPDDFMAKLKRLRTVYEKACRELEEERATRAKTGLPVR
jgi:hypothetical protein